MLTHPHISPISLSVILSDLTAGLSAKILRLRLCLKCKEPVQRKSECGLKSLLLLYSTFVRHTSVPSFHLCAIRTPTTLYYATSLDYADT